MNFNIYQIRLLNLKPKRLFIARSCFISLISITKVIFGLQLLVIAIFFTPSHIFADDSDVFSPLITISGVSEGSYYSTAVYPEISISDINLAYSIVTLKLNNSIDSVYVSGTEIKKDGRYRLFAEAHDSAGNASYEPVNFVVDKTKPAISITGVSNDAYYSADVWFKVKISETNPVREDITLDGAACLENETVWVKDEGGHKLAVDTLDKAGNSNLKEYNFTIDKTFPLIDISGVEDNQFYSTFVTLRISVIDANLDSSSINLTLNGNVFENGTEIKEDGDYVLSVLAADYALNKSAIGIRFKVMLSPRLRITTRPGDAAIYLDGNYSFHGEYKGATTAGDEGKLLIENNLSCGKHLLKIKKPGYVDYIELINFGIGELIEKNIDLILCKKEYFYERQLLDLDSTNVSLRPWVIDYNQDGKKDLVVRASDGKGYLYLNTGNDNLPQFETSFSLQPSAISLFEVYYETVHGSRATVHGSSDGKIYFDSAPVLVNGEPLDVGGHSWPFIFDFDHDGKDDLLSGNQKGEVFFFKNIGDSEAVFDSSQLIQAGSKDLDIGSYSRPFVVDWNNDNFYDLLIGSSEGVYVFLAADKIVDATAPITIAQTVPPVPANEWVNIDIKIIFIASDDLSGFESTGGTYYKLDNGPWAKGQGLELAKEGSFVISYYSIDDAGNAETAKLLKINIDKTPPVIANLIIPDINERTNKSIKISADINDALSGLDTALYQYKLSPYAKASGDAAAWINFKTLKLNWENLTGQIIRFRIYAKDKAGNERYSEERAELIENINDAPSITSYEPKSKSLHIKEGERIDFKVSVFDADNDELGLTWYLDSAVVCAGTSDWTFYAGYDDSGEHEVRFRAMDSRVLGSRVLGSSLSAEENWKVDIEDVLVRPPLNLSAKTKASGRVFLKWDENKYCNLLGYNVYRDGKKINKALVTKDHYLDTGLIDGTEYVYFVRAVDIDGKESGDSNEISAALRSSDFPDAPFNLEVNNNGLLSWEKPQDCGIAGYYLYTSTDIDTSKFDIGEENKYQLNNLVSGIQYYFAVSCYDNYRKESEKSNIVSFSVYDTSSPCQVHGVRVRGTGRTGELKIKWRENDEPDLAGYKIYYGLKSSEYNAPVLAGVKEKFVLSGLKDFTKYFIAVSAIDTQKNEGLKSDEEIGAPYGNLTFMPSPEHLIIASGNREVKLSWNPVLCADLSTEASAKVDGYKVYFGRSEELVIAPLIISDTTFVFNNLSNNNKYYAAVSSFKGKDESERVPGIVLPKDESAPDAPVGLTCLSGSDGTGLILSWSLNKEWDLAGYKIAYKTSLGYFSEPKIIGKINRFDISGLTEGEQYFIAVFAIDTENNTSNPSIITGVPLKSDYKYNNPPFPPLLDISCEKGLIRLYWTSSGGNIDEYRIYRREAGESVYKRIAETNKLTCQNRAVEEGKIYYYVVTAFNENSLPKESVFSNEAVMRPKLKLGDIEIESDVPVEGRVDGYDLIILSISFGSAIGGDYYNPNVDLNGDGVIDGIDLGILANNFGKQY